MAHIHEVVYNLVHWFDDKIFRLYPTWDDCIRAGIFPRPELERFFGPAPEGQKDPPGKANYAQCARRSIGRRVIAKMLEGTANPDEIGKAIANFPMSDQRRRYEAEQAEKERQEAERLREERQALQRDMHMENSVTRNKVAHTHEVVYQLMHWFDDKVFEQCPTWEDCIRTGVFSSPELERFFGPAPEGQKDPPGKANYARCVKTGIGRNVIAKMLEGTENVGAIQQALETLPMTERRRRFEQSSHAPPAMWVA